MICDGCGKESFFLYGREVEGIRFLLCFKCAKEVENVNL